VWESLDLLVSVGLVERVPFHEARVLQLTIKEIADTYSLRLRLESNAYRMYALETTSE
jgi:DNA-binding GntR family transcriptional regulator